MDGKVRETQIFNLKENPNEYFPEHHKKGEMQTNLANYSKCATKLAEMEKLLLEQMITYENPFRLWNKPMKK